MFPNGSGDNYKLSDQPTNFLKEIQFVFLALLRVLLCCTSVGLVFPVLFWKALSAFIGKRNAKVLLLGNGKNRARLKM